MGQLCCYGILLLLSIICIHGKFIVYDYCVIGAGPGGLQIAYYLENAGRNYVVFERNNISGSFFTHFPRHRNLLSINKKNTGFKNAEFNLRHDWNTLLSHNHSLIMPRYSDRFYPHADELVNYLNDYAKYLHLKIKYNKNITLITRVHYKDSISFKLIDQHKKLYVCHKLIISTGLATPIIPKDAIGLELAEGYESMSTNSSKFINKTILILGQGNSGFETAQSLSAVSNFIHVLGRSGIRLATSTHYIGDVRGINSKVVDSYQLKTLDGLLEEESVSSIAFVKNEESKLQFFHRHPKTNQLTESRGSLKYDHVIRCLGFQHDKSIYHKNAKPKPGAGRLWKYPLIKENYESQSIENMFFAGALAHSLDYRHSGGCCIQGYRYTARALHHLLEWRFHKIAWPAISYTTASLFDRIITRINQASGLYQMFGTLADIILIGEDNYHHQYLEEVPIRTLRYLHELTGKKISNGFITLTFEYGKNFSKRSTDSLGKENYQHTVKTAHRSKNIHPILRYYRRPIRGLTAKARLPRANKVHHVLEDFLTDWSVYTHHGHYIKLFLESVFRSDLDNYYGEDCFKMAMSHNMWPSSCSRPIIQRSSSIKAFI